MTTKIQKAVADATKQGGATPAAAYTAGCWVAGIDDKLVLAGIGAINRYEFGWTNANNMLLGAIQRLPCKVSDLALDAFNMVKGMVR